MRFSATVLLYSNILSRRRDRMRARADADAYAFLNDYFRAFVDADMFGSD